MPVLTILLALAAPQTCVDDGLQSLRGVGSRADTLRLGDEWATAAQGGDDCAEFLAGYVIALTSSASENEWERRQQGAAWLEEAQRNFQDEPRTYLGLGLLLYYRQSRTDARRMFGRAMDRSERATPLTPRERALVHYTRGMIHADFWRDFRSYGELATSSRGQWHCGRYENPVTDNFSGSSADLGWLADLNLLCPELFERNMARYFLPRSNLRRGDLAGLIAEFTLAFATDTTFARPLEALLGDLVYLERWAQADSIVQRLQVAFPDAAEPLLYFALVRHGLGDDRAASIAFSRGFGRMSDEHIRGYGDISQLLPPAQSARYATADTTQQAQFAAAYWNALDPLYLTPVNERRVAHYARVVAADLMFTAAATQVRGRDTFAGQIWIRYGRPLTMREVTLASGRLSFWDYGPGPDIAMTRATAYQGYRPTDAAVEYAESLRRTSPQIYHPTFADSVEPMGLQLVRSVGTDRAPSLLILAEWPEQLAGGEGGLVLLDPSYQPAAQWRGPRPESGGIRSELQRVPPGTYNVSIEILDRESRRFARARDTVTAVVADTGFGVSDLVLARGAGGSNRAADFAELNLDPRFSPTVRRRGALVVAWEAWLFSGTDVISYVVELELQDASRRPVLARILGGVGIGGDREPATRISFQSQRPLANGKTAEWISLGTDLNPGDYLLVMRFRAHGREIVRERAVSIRP